ALLAGGLGLAGACSGNEKKGAVGGTGGTGSPEQTGSMCRSPSDCYPMVNPTMLRGAVECLAVSGGYCTHQCGSDSDCCAAPNECKTNLRQVCSPFTSMAGQRCFLSCEPGDLRPADGGIGPVDEQEFCQREASPYFICRSTGGGSANRKVCLPGVCGNTGTACVAIADCTAGLDCLLGFNGGYCGKADCVSNADCAMDARCVRHTDGRNYCFKTCITPTDCTFCRLSSVAASCVATVTFADPTTTGSVCVPPPPPPPPPP
ncbi:MAG TPA: hypothetical protein VGJ84_14105, partial [Polyangiaceae bacterium]